MKLAFPTDFSAASGKVFQYTVRLAEALNASLDLFYVFQGVDVLPTSPPATDKEWKAVQRKQLEHQLQEFIGKYLPVGVNVLINTHILVGMSEREGIALFSELVEPVDWMVIGTKGDFSLSKAIWGTRVSYVVEHSRCSVLVVPEGAVFEPLREVAFADTFSRENKNAADAVVSLAQQLPAALYCVAMRGGEAAYTRFQQAFPKESRATFVELDPGVSRLEALNEFAVQRGVDLLIMLPSYRHLVSRFFRYSQAQKMALQTQVPLLVLR